jgi:hypothetical protein
MTASMLKLAGRCRGGHCLKVGTRIEPADVVSHDDSELGPREGLTTRVGSDPVCPLNAQLPLTRPRPW